MDGKRDEGGPLRDLPARLRTAQEGRDAERARADAATALFLAVANLHAANGRGEVLAALDEIAQTVFGGAEAAVYVLAGDPARLDPVHLGGPRARAAAGSFALGVGLPGRAATARRLVVEPTGEACGDAAVALGPDGAGALVLHGIPLVGGELPEGVRQWIAIVAYHGAIALRRAT